MSKVFYAAPLLFLVSSFSQAAILSSAPENCLDYTSGAYIGLGVGGMSSVLRSQSPRDDSNIPFIAKWPQDLSLKYAALSKVSTDRVPFQGIVGDLHFGWDNRFERSHAVMGFMAGANIANGTGQLNYPTVIIKPNAVGDNSDVKAITSPILIRSLVSGYSAFRFGLTIGRALVYTKLGLNFRYFRAKAYAVKETGAGRPDAKADQNVAMNANAWNLGFLSGVGIDFRLSPRLVLFTCADVVIGSKTKLTLVNPQKDEVLTSDKKTVVRFRPIVFTGLIGIRLFIEK